MWTATHGRFNPSVKQSFGNGRCVDRSLRLWPALLLVALLLNLVELLLGRWRGIVESGAFLRKLPPLTR
jgi:hypothetical protein